MTTFEISGIRTNLWVPARVNRTRPVTVLLALDGMGGSGERISAGLIEEADRRGWLLVAPTIPYSDNWTNPERLAQEEITFTRAINVILNSLPEQTGLTLKQRVFVFGFSRGAQLGHRFAFFYPERVRAVAAVASGTYTIPRVLDPDGKSELNLPMGLGDCSKKLGRPAQLGKLSRQVRFLVEVGANDNKDSEVPRPFDHLLGKNRLDRARSFARLLNEAGIEARLVVVPDVGHTLAPVMRSKAVAFFDQALDEERAWARVFY